MADLYERNGVLLLDDNGTSLRGCCCDECSLVRVSLGVGTYTVPSSGGGGSGIHRMDSKVLTVCTATARISASTWTEFWRERDSSTCNPIPACGSAVATALCEYYTMKVSVPFKRGSTSTHVGTLYFYDTKQNTSSDSYWLSWDLSVEYFSQSGGQPTSITRKPDVSISISGNLYNESGSSIGTQTRSTNGTDAAWSNLFRTYAQPGSIMGEVTAEVYFT